MANPLKIPDKAGQGLLWEQVRRLSNDYLDTVNKGDTHEAARIEHRLNAKRKQFHALHHHKERPCDPTS